MKITRDLIDAASEGELCALAFGATEFAGGRINGDGLLAVLALAALRGWEMTLVSRVAFGMDSIAAVAFGLRQQAAVSVRHPRPEIAAFRAYLYAVHTPPAAS